MDNNKENTIDLIDHENPGFEVPKGYFNSVEDDFTTRLKEANLPNDPGFIVSENYFDSLEDSLMERIRKKETKVIPLTIKVLRFASIAAVFAFIFISIWNKPDSKDDLSSKEIAAWIDINIEDIDADDIFEELDRNIEFTDVDLLESSIKNNSIDFYFDENDTYILIEESQGLFDEIN